MEKLAPKRIENILVLTPMQEGMLFHYLQDPQSALYFEQLSLEISGEIDLKLFKDAWNAVIQSNEMLRTVFRWEKLEKPSQVILKEHQCSFVFHDLSDKEDIRKQRALAGIKSRDKDEGFDLTRVPFRVILCKLTKTQYEMIISNHHILYDGWSNGIILKEFFNTYRVLSKGEQTLPLSAKTSFKEYIKWLQSRDRKKHEYFWQEYLAGFEMAAELPIKRKNEETTGAGNYSINLGEDIHNKLDSFIKNNKVTLASIFYSAWGILLQRYCGSEDVVFGTTVSGRSADVKGIEDMVGLFINTIPLRINTYPGETIIDAVLRTGQVLRDREEFENTPLVDIQSYRGPGGSGTLFDTIVAIENYPLDDFVQGTHNLSMENNLISVHSYSMVEATHYDLTVGIMPFKGIEIKFSFKQELFENDAIENLAGHFKTIIQTIVNYLGMVLSQLEIISIEEKNRILNEFNNTAVAYPRDKTIHQLFEEQAAKTPDQVGLVGVVEPVGPVTITYRQLNERSDRLAGLLIEKGVLPDIIVGIMMERSVEMVIVIMGILKSGGAYLPIDPECPQERIDYMLKDSEAKLLVNTSNLAKEGEKVRSWEGENVFFEDISKSSNNSSYPLTFLPSYLLNSSNLAYVIFTSGSTGIPKGVPITHANISPLLHWGYKHLGIASSDRTIQNLAYYFDWSVWEIFITLTSGACLYTLPDEILMNPGICIPFMIKSDITVLHATPTRYWYFIHVGRKLETLKYLFLGAEKLTIELLKCSFESVRGNCRVFNMYGPTETTIISAVMELRRDEGDKFNTLSSVPIGKPAANFRILVLDRSSNMCPVNISGELYIGGDGVAGGYLNNPELTSEKFNRSYRPNKTYIFYKTGDLARWLNNGNIEFLGRRDYQVKIRGFRVELGEIEKRLLKHEQINEAVVLAKEDTIGDKYLAAYFVSDREITEAELREYLTKDLPEYMIPSYFIRLEKMPLNPSGKVDRNRLPEPELKSGEAYMAPRNEIEKNLLEIWTDILDKNILKYRIGINDNFFRLGGHSLKATILALKVHKTFQVNLPLAEIFRTPTIRGLANYITTAVKARYVSIEPVEKKEYYPMSSAQKRMYVEQQMQLDSVSYNMPAILILEGEISYERLKGAFQQLIERHESLRTFFVTVKGEGMQIIREHVDFDIEYWESKEENCQEIAANFPEPFDLSKAPLLRVGLIKIGEAKHLFMIDMHHIISDGVSHQILAKDFTAVYNGENLPPLKLQYKDFSEWQNRLFETDFIKKQEEYWLNRFKDNVPILNLPTDYPRPPGNISNKGDSIDFHVREDVCAKLYEIVKKTGITVYTFLLAAYNILLSRFTGQTDILVVSPITGRRHNDLENIIGMFVNMLVMRNQPDGEKIFREFLGEVKTNLLNAYENQEYQFPELTNRLNLQGYMHKNPLLNTVFTMQNIDVKKIALYKYDRKISVFDLHLIASEDESDGRIDLSIEYAVELFKESTIREISKHYLEIIEKVIQNPDIRIKDIRFSSHLLALKQKEFTDGKDFGF